MWQSEKHRTWEALKLDGPTRTAVPPISVPATTADNTSNRHFFFYKKSDNGETKGCRFAPTKYCIFQSFPKLADYPFITHQLAKTWALPADMLKEQAPLGCLAWMKYFMQIRHWAHSCCKIYREISEPIVWHDATVNSFHCSTKCTVVYLWKGQGTQRSVAPGNPICACSKCTASLTSFEN